MAKYTGPACRQCRREGVKLFSKGERCFTEKCAMNRRTGAPGQHGAARKKVSEYGLQLREVQKAKRYYGIPERQFRNYFKIADSKEGMAGENLLTLIERRLDNVVFRMGMGESRRDARQLVTHGHFLVNGKKADIPSIILRAGDVVTVKDTSRKSEKIKTLVENLDNRTFPAWLDVDKQNVTATVSTLPKREDIDFPFEEHFIVEWYSKKA
ncbi:MAG: 30S ribosomal protein S4 [Clostridiales bacterium]|nr:MAG: 30S ribosomal protein S4 [Clostridiales bacterium]